MQTLFDDERAVSPVIGVIMMVSIAVILGSVVATVVFGISDVSEVARQAGNVVECGRLTC
ncbi:type IV pilin N-terminal domain-containing protein [Haloglomus litoreum]|uniref:type IV pilin N-terminal domain-containing protein n=1 Tax=Haloglomus litoreum TaxID=3034026 RepID=UPI0023E8077C|nr:type IV pilin N-terminal domain-containing protein [Haloglomus sp. DT116]